MRHSHNPHLDDETVSTFEKIFESAIKNSEFERFLCEIFSNLSKKFQNLESISCVHWGPPYCTISIN